MKRRQAVSTLALIFGGTMVGSNLFLTGCKTEEKKTGLTDFSADEVALLDEVAETIIPTTSTPGAKAAKVGAFMKIMVTDCYEEKNQKVFVDGIAALQAASEKQFGKDFMNIDAAQRKELLTALDKEQREYQKSKKPEDPNHYFKMMKDLTLQGYFTSEVGATQALRYVPVPGKYEGCIPYNKGDKAWAT
ncbi:gluconate 2-dehydrogenase subunit 3 family protein [Flavihumibacter stibioxidans]|uniref:Twin-arginine translocation pathway signal protein n=1 Tax=Flavihumibacter stibioxidans TaxID=1834163 RepID=A0ABR7M699_9BACT|nr:gluconate 2-dehydrogenase subunit 3 family protein [Flavihumibacter stibioxidans]MBC6490044.1 twin-arginine translocation pathway signal protein [Flavihumibacter stibioxidans]